MTELYIDGKLVVLPEKFSIDITTENPFFTKNGKYTYDIELSLKYRDNAKLYKHLNRLNNTSIIQTKRSAYLVVDNKVVLNGIEIILEISEKSVKVQLASGESELNFLIGYDKKLNSLDLGSYNVYSSEESGFFKPVFSSNEEKIYNEPRIVDSNNIIIAAGVKSPLIQPKLSFVLKRIINSFGYSIQDNAFDTSFLQYVHILNGKKTIKYSQMLPDWTVAELFTELENIFNIAFIVDEYAKKVSVVFKNNYYNDTSNKTFISEVLDEFTQTIDEENKLSYKDANIGYELSDDEYFKYQKLDKGIIDRAQPMSFPSYSDIETYMNGISDIKSLKNKLFKSEYSRTEYICTEHNIIIPLPPWHPGGGIPISKYLFLKKVNIFKDIVENTNNSDLDIELKIIPAPISIVDASVYNSADANNNTVLYNMKAPLPTVETDEGDDLNFIHPGSIEDEDYVDIQSVLEGESDTENQNSFSTDQLFIFFYNGKHDIFSENADLITNTPKVDYPIGFVDYLCEDERFGERAIDGNNLSLRLDSDYGLKPLFESVSINTTKEYTFKFIYNGKLDPKTIFVFNNKEFVCKQIKYIVNSQGMNKIIEGVFYPID